MYDQLGGGFHRYSTDPKWRVPHFEKMAYDQAMALKSYAQAYEITHDEDFARIAKSIVGYVDGTMLDTKSHTFYSHQDADAFAGDDGSYYTWTEAEVRHLLKGRDLEVALLHFGITDDPGARTRRPNRPARRDVRGRIARKLKISVTRAAASIAPLRRCCAAREKRKPPLVDTAALIDRNALMVSAYLIASEALGDEQMKRIALDNLDYLYVNARAPDGSFYHVLDRGKPSVTGLAADQVYMMSALLEAYQASGDRKYLDRAKVIGRVGLRGLSRSRDRPTEEPRAGHPGHRPDPGGADGAGFLRRSDAGDSGSRGVEFSNPRGADLRCDLCCEGRSTAASGR